MRRVRHQTLRTGIGGPGLVLQVMLLYLFAGLHRNKRINIKCNTSLTAYKVLVHCWTSKIQDSIMLTPMFGMQ